VGGLTEAVKGVDKQLTAQSDKLDTLTQHVSQLVKREDCDKNMNVLRRQFFARIEQSTAAAADAAAEAAEEAVSEVTKKTKIPSAETKPLKKSLWERVVEQSKNITAVASLLALLTAALIFLHQFANRTEQVYAASKESQKVTVQVMQELLRQMKALNKPDAGQ